tara:strand:- start:156 stop:449 length:294 start_codon:yes stop_codon:yes gene_type:complete
MKNKIKNIPIRRISKNLQIIQGRKKEIDRIILYNGKPVSFSELALMIIFFMENEDNLYPNGLGREMIKEYIRKVLDEGQVPTDPKYLSKKSKCQLSS